MENRKYTRLCIDVMAELHLEDDSCLYGETQDISLDGAYIYLTPPSHLKIGDPCRIILIIKIEEDWVKTEFRGRVAHLRETGIGIRFEQACMAHHEVFLRLLIDGNEDIDVLLEELSNNPGGHFHFTD